MRKPGPARLLPVILVLFLAALACSLPGSAPAADNSGAQPTADAPTPAAPDAATESAGSRQITPDAAAELSTPDGASLHIPAGAFDATTTLTMEARPDAPLPETTTLHQLVSTPFELFQEGDAAPRAPLTLRIPYDPASLPTGASPDALTIVWWDGETWQDVPSQVDAARNEVVGEIHHFSLFAAAWSRFEAAVASGDYFDAQETYGQFTIHYTTQAPGGAWPWSTPPPDDRPLLDDVDENGSVDYIELLGDGLLQSQEAFDAYLVQRGLVYPAEPIDVYVAHIAPAAGIFDPLTRRMVLDNDRATLTTAAHELFHFIQNEFAPGAIFRQRWWVEATAEWAEGLVVPGSTDFYGLVRRYMPNPPRDGYGRLHARDYLEFYAGSSLAYHLDRFYPDFVMRTFTPLVGFSDGEAWYETFDRLLKESYGTTFEEAIDDYFVSYFYHRDFVVDAPALFDSADPAFLANPALLGATGFYTRVSQTLPPISGRLITVDAAADLEEGTLVVAQGGRGLTAYVYAFADAISGGERTRVLLPGSGERLGVIIGATDDSLAVAGFGGTGDPPVSQVNLVATNPATRFEAGLDLEIYVIDPPQNFSAENIDADPLRLSWQPSRLPLGESAADDGALVSYRIYILTADTGDSWPLPATANSYELSRAELPLDQGAVTIVLRATDKYGNESPDSDPIALGASLALASTRTVASDCFYNDRNDWNYCDITVSATFSYSVTTIPSTLTCHIDSTTDYVAEIGESAGTLTLEMFSRGANIDFGGGPRMRCELLPDNIDMLIPFAEWAP